MDITETDQQLITPSEARKFDRDLAHMLDPAEVANIRLARMYGALDGELGGWPEGFEFSTDAMAAYALLANTLENEAGRMLEWAREIRYRSAHLWFVQGPAADA